MEIFIEQIVSKKKSVFDIVLVFVLLTAATGVAFLLFNFSYMYPSFGTVLFLAIAAVYYFSYTFAVSRNLEYEYSMVNHEIDIDKIMNRKKRKRITTLNVRKMECFGKKSKSSDFNKYYSDVAIKKLYACEDKNDDELYFAVFVNDGTKFMLLFNPKEEIVEKIVKFNPREAFEI